MVQFSVPARAAGNTRRQAFAFCVKENAVMFAGSRNGSVPGNTARGLVSAFARLGFSFVVGCAPGIDACFRKALAESAHTDNTFVACAFVKRIGHIMDTGLFASCVVPQGITPRAALARRTLWMVKRASLIVLFPDNPENGRWGKGSTLAFKAAVMQLKPLFVVSKHQPEEKGIYKVLPACFQGLAHGYWVIPHPIQKGGTCDDEY
jgi:hypothetical protein